MFTVKRPEKEPENCPLCLYAPASLADLKNHLGERHSAVGFERCQASNCGVVCLTAKELKSHHATAHKRRKTADKLTLAAAPKEDFQSKEVTAPHEVCIQHIISDTRKYLSAMKRLGRTHSADFSQCADFQLLSLVTHGHFLSQNYDTRLFENPDNPDAPAQPSRKRGHFEFSIATLLDLETPIKELQLDKHQVKPSLPTCRDCGAMFLTEQELLKHSTIKCDHTDKLSFTA